MNDESGGGGGVHGGCGGHDGGDIRGGHDGCGGGDDLSIPRKEM